MLNRIALSAWLLLVSLLPLTSAAHASDEPGQAPAPATGQVDEAAPAATEAAAEQSTSADRDDSIGDILSLPQLADRGRFSDVLQGVRPYAARGGGVSSLVRDLELYAQHAGQWEQARQQAFDAAIDELDGYVDAGDVQEALYSAIKASKLAADRQRLLQSERFTALVQRTHEAIAKARQQGRWIDKLALYRSLDLLFDESGRYHQDVREAEQRLLWLRLYTPKQYVQMLVERAKAHGEEDPPQPDLGDADWHMQLAGVNESMLRQALAHAARLHVNRQGYEPLMVGGMQALMRFVQVDDLAAEFPSLSNKTAVSRFNTALGGLIAESRRRGETLNFLDAARIVRDVLDANDATINLPDEVVLYELANGAMGSLDDFSSIVWPYEQAQFNRNLQGTFYGIGVQIEKRDGRLTVVSPLEGTPAHRAGIRANDIIARVEGKDTSGWSLDQAVREITGPEDTEVRLGIEREGLKDLIDMRVRRAEIVIESIRGWDRKPGGGWEYFIDRESGIGYIRLTQFIPQTDMALVNAINQMEQDGGLNGLILDLRGNPGGLLQSAIQVADRFIDSGPIVSTAGPDENRNHSYGARPERTAGQFPLIVLINEGSASASEIVSGAVQDYGRGLIVGRRSYGKGSVQDPFPIDRGRARLKLTTQYYKLPRGRIIHREPGRATWGIEPNLTVSMTDEQYLDLRDFRQEVDILREDQQAPPTSAGADGSDGAEADARPPRADDILARGMDPQLETAVMILKTRLVARELAMARMKEAARQAD